MLKCLKIEKRFLNNEIKQFKKINANNGDVQWPMLSQWYVPVFVLIHAKNEFLSDL